MASLKGLIEELEIINGIIERMAVLLMKAREDIDYLRDRAAELPLERNGGDGVCWTCPNCEEENSVEVPACTKCYYTPS